MLSATIRKSLEKARKYFDSGKVLHSMQIYHRLISEYPSFVEAYIELAFIYIKLGKENSAEKLLRKAYELEPNNEEVLFMLGNICLRSKRFDEAIKFYTSLLSLDYPVVHYNLGLAYYHKGNYLEAEAEFKKVLKLDPDFPKAFESLGEILIKLGNYKEAIDYLQRGIKREPYNYTLYHLLAISYWNLGELNEAKRAIETAIDLEPNKAVLWEICGEISLELGEIEEAERYFNRAIQLDGSLVDSFINLGLIYKYRGDNNEADKFFNEALRIDPNAKFKIDEKLKLLKNG
ncbi:tetratricopeptide repeat protein [Candidatus Kryptonium thompsonii]|uniref:Tetratricopeptide repeat-containing protein n=2 Tax=Candidatus Kryptonium thompsonii TaxID=1633631 RepID=A0A0P1MI29_9BACT|nr:tetratricopeptide repeat protein [Candidatus Kryptonium thompsoni]CUS95082.1 Tetratricopeptide repeat-containing protein [Candidatus Kryptonium thompsoni]CUT07650.1 Tetratricopeptide repeat-containing protein [Candidatus Kryptonium thompsoni]CUU07057.1 Tetratricopeptide repeat-containing protein [Candidatus Kryptonium thompsoni]